MQLTFVGLQLFAILLLPYFNRDKLLSFQLQINLSSLINPHFERYFLIVKLFIQARKINTDAVNQFIMILFRFWPLNNISKINQLQMYISQLLSKGQGSKAPLLSSIIEPDGRCIDKFDEFIIKKVPLADRNLIREYKERADRGHLNVPQVNIIQNSDFYLTVHVQKGKIFDSKDLIKIPYNKRAKLLADVLRGVGFLSEHYGYFYLTAKMLSYKADGRINLWMNEDYFFNKPQYAICHGRFSEEIFIADFKQTFGGNFQEMKEFRKAKRLNSLLKILDKGEDIYQSLLMSEPVTKESLIYRDQALKFSNVINPGSQYPFQEHRFDRDLKHAESLHQLVINIHCENDESQSQDRDRKLSRTLSSPSTKINLSRESSNHRNAYGSLTSQNLPRINFTYSSKQAWKKKQSHDSENDGRFLTSLKIKNNDPQENSISESSKDFLKASFPYTTTHSFCPIASFGSINLNPGPQEIVEDPEREVKIKGVQAAKIQVQMEEIGDMEMQFQNLFESSVKSEEENLQNLEVIMQEFQSILQG